MTLYGADYFRRGNKYTFEETNRTLDPNWQNDSLKISILKQYKYFGRVLDVGCGKGGFLEIAKQEGYDVCGLEASEYAARYVRKKLRIDVVNCSLSDAVLPRDYYDIVTMWDVIEHLDDPCSALRVIHRTLRPSGLLVISTGDASSLWARATGRLWQLLTPPQHLFFFDRQSLRRALELNEFAVKGISYLGKRTTMGFVLFKAHETLGPVVRPLIAIVTGIGLNNVQAAVNLHDIMTCVAEKK
jgi:SAM-dependent methyltransferase